MTDPTPGFIIFLGALGILAWWLVGRQRMARMPPHPDLADYWTTPLYLRSNTPVFDGSTAIVPSLPDSTWSLATYYAD